MIAFGVWLYRDSSTSHRLLFWLLREEARHVVECGLHLVLDVVVVEEEEFWRNNVQGVFCLES